MLETATALHVEPLQEGQQITVVEGSLRQCTGQVVAFDDETCTMKPDGWVEGAYLRLPRHVVIARP